MAFKKQSSESRRSGIEASIVVVEDELGAWNRGVWKQKGDAALPPWRPHPDIGGETAKLPPIRREQIPTFRGHLRSYKLRTGVGSDQFHPRPWAVLPDEALWAIMQALGAAERLGDWPTQIKELHVFLQHGGY